MMKHTLLVVSAAALQFGIAECTRADTFGYSGSIAQYTVPTTGTYNITAYGAQGGVGAGGVL